MPEGHTLHRLARLHQRRFAGAPVTVSSPQGRFADSAALVDGRVLRRASAWGKHLFHHYADGPIVHVHLGLYGTFTEWARPNDVSLPEPVGQVRMRMVGADYGTDLRGPTVCELLDEGQVGDVVARLGPDPLRGDADPSWAWARITKSRRPIGALLMDQTVIAGVGNVYRSELLFRHRIEPFRPGREISQTAFDAAWTDLVALMKVGLRRGKIVVVRPEHDHGPPSYLPERPRTYVYRRAGEPCRGCGATIRTAVLEGRNVFWCPQCQV
ncbi:Fpg/Nei family DNA glycosylase [Mycobacterium haemophilum]|uniref:Endonuclease 8 1 n=1 Tax=Mycobacterium haemophilum TaxID=29311 RepID=A0A0I9U887_9MYCO|nr:DNA-formamidopyrimidine glycosylase family protein [Mycobacterium haemophilum]AKN16625.1 DNA glycosylase [Mycobacterium haemophilum DSM 44634]KLO28392.1 DNA glycosylase [Mycobacterium haemophilum]KLO37433.1 DNA glycosylase [Mycobacterium haemophilum]KLO43982.1 DNA glycosylase [Mycobacterium haemophilum]KLO49262.1 DNA glycosylase [Mycobacterium haemophilum]